MPRRLRNLAAEAVVEVTIRTIQGRFLLRPSDDVHEIVLGILARAQERTGIQLHAFVFMSNHYHLILTIPDGNALAKFECYLNTNLSKELGRLYGWKHQLWSRRYTAIPILDDLAMVDRLHYLLSHGCKEGLVARPQDWPGPSSLPAMLTGQPLRGFWFDRTAEHPNRRCGAPIDKYKYATQYEVQLTPLPCWDHLDTTAYRAKIRALVDQIEHETAETNRTNHHAPAGPAAVLAQDPHAHHDPTSSPAPPCHTSLPSLRKVFIAAYYAFLDLYIEASALFRAGNPDAQFPPDCFPPPRPFTTPVEARAPT